VRKSRQSPQASTSPLTVAEATRQAAAFIQSGNLAEAERLCRVVLGNESNSFDALHLLGIVAARRGRFEQADQLLARALAINPKSPEAHSNRGNVQKARGHLAEALASYDRALALKPDLVDGLNNRAGALKDLERYDEALASYDGALALKPDLAVAHYNRGAVLSALKRHDEALVSYDRALAIKPGFAEALNNRGAALAALKRDAEALASYDRALVLRPAFAEALQNRGATLSCLGRHEEAGKALEQALKFSPDLPFARGTLLHSKMHCCEWSTYEGESKRVIADVRAGKRACEPFMFLGISDSPQDQLRCSRTWVHEQCPPSASSVWAGPRYRHDRIRLAYVSSDFRAHPLGHLMAALFEQHDRSRFETIAVSLGSDDRSPMRSRLEHAFDRFIDVRQHSDREIAKLMREMEVDIAVDRNGFTTGARPGIFALRPAPIQVSYLAYPGTTGADHIDYVIADETVIPREEQSCYTEGVVYLPDSYQVNDSKRHIAERTPTRTEAGLPDRGFVFCSFNNNYKITPQMFDIWMSLLRQVEESVLWLLEGNATAQRNLRKEAAARGVDGDRLIFAPRIAPEDHLARHRLADLFLDTLPCNAHTTASDALWAGLPVLTCMGTTFAGRVAASLLRAIGLPRLITHSLDEYKSLALELATQRALLEEVRQALERNRHEWPLFDTSRFRRHIEAAYLQMWDLYQRGETPASFTIEPLS
jgi:predicted O-linked N-acetylglucosamine transferase (SPINDLY family)